MAKSKRGSERSATGSGRKGGGPAAAGGSGGFVGQLGIAETGGTSPGLVGIALALGLAVLTYPIGWLWRRTRRRP